MLQVKVLILGHTDDDDNPCRQPKVREVTIPEYESVHWDVATDDERLELVYYYGQNDFSEGFPEHNTTYSLSPGDVVMLPNRQGDGHTQYVVRNCGWKSITDDELASLIAMSARDRRFCDLVA